MTTAVETRTRVDPRSYVDSMKELISDCYEASQFGDVMKVLDIMAQLTEVRRTVVHMVASRAKVRERNDTDPYSGKRGRGVQPDEVARRAHDSGLDILYLLRSEVSDGNVEDPEKRVFTDDALKGIEKGARTIKFHFDEWCRTTPWSR